MVPLFERVFKVLLLHLFLRVRQPLNGFPSSLSVGHLWVFLLSEYANLWVSGQKGFEDWGSKTNAGEGQRADSFHGKHPKWVWLLSFGRPQLDASFLVDAYLQGIFQLSGNSRQYVNPAFFGQMLNFPKKLQWGFKATISSLLIILAELSRVFKICNSCSRWSEASLELCWNLFYNFVQIYTKCWWCDLETDWKEGRHCLGAWKTGYYKYINV